MKIGALSITAPRRPWPSRPCVGSNPERRHSVSRFRNDGGFDSVYELLAKVSRIGPLDVVDQLCVEVQRIEI